MSAESFIFQGIVLFFFMKMYLIVKKAVFGELKGAEVNCFVILGDKVFSK